MHNCVNEASDNYERIFSGAFAIVRKGGNWDFSQALLQSEKQGADESERKRAEALESSEERCSKLEETERRVHQLQESLNRNWIVTKYCNRIRNNPTWPVPSLHTTIQQEWACKVDIQKGYVEEIKQGNLGTIIKIQEKPVPSSQEMAKFKRLYICWGSLKRGFQLGCRPIIGLDGCHLKGPFGGIILTAVSIDANNHIYQVQW
ncbi:hypothetical protein Vadar_029078 [Vaccinium darrowii]|uniref:Uncharacterized protein n=1 Tax=Vaccinium darrowii TaxID=229202 RepID=A0ACB7YA96_9ERIC|nr:hypothetical protein Vadar_029078 [Vaccinium darrowii]